MMTAGRCECRERTAPGSPATFPESAARIVVVPPSNGGFDIEVDCVAATEHRKKSDVCRDLRGAAAARASRYLLCSGPIASPRVGANRRLRRQHSLWKPRSAGLGPLALQLAGREGPGPMAHARAASRDAELRPFADLPRLPPARGRGGSRH